MRMVSHERLTPEGDGRTGDSCPCSWDRARCQSGLVRDGDKDKDPSDMYKGCEQIRGRRHTRKARHLGLERPWWVSPPPVSVIFALMLWYRPLGAGSQ